VQQFLLAYCAIVQGTTIKVRAIIADSNNKIVAGVQEQLLIPIVFVVGIEFREFLSKMVSGCSGSRFCANSLTLMC
jgi:hypothetical protein